VSTGAVPDVLPGSDFNSYKCSTPGACSGATVTLNFNAGTFSPSISGDASVNVAVTGTAGGTITVTYSTIRRDR